MYDKQGNLLLDTYPADNEINSNAYIQAINSNNYQPGDLAIIFTPDDTHFEIAKYCIQQGLHVLVTKPVVKTLKDHIELDRLSREFKVLVGIYYCVCIITCIIILCKLVF